jgi:tetratricopeptide (TPR) repeat protein
MVTGAARDGALRSRRRLTLGRVLTATVLLGSFAGGAQLAYAKKDTGPLAEVVEKYAQAKIPKKDAPPGPVTLSPDDCKSFAKDFIKAGEKEKREAEGLFNAGSVYDHCNNDKEAEGLYNQALGKNPKFAPAMNNLGVLYQKRNQTQQALSQFENAIKVDPKSPQAVQAYNNRGALLYERAKQAGSKGFDEAIGSIRRALAIDSASMAAYQLLASIYYQTAEADKSKLKLAQLVCDEAKKINPDYAPIYHTLGLIKLRSKDVTGALTEFRKAAALDPSLLEAQMNIAAISLSARSYKQAEEAFQAVLKKQPGNFDATIGMGVAARGQRKADESESWYNKALALDPKNCGVLYNLGLLYQDYKSGSPEDMKKGQDLYNKYLACGRTDPEHQSDAKRRIKDIDDTFKALEEQRKLEAELKAQMAEMEKMQKIQEEQMKAAGGGAAPAPAPAPAPGAEGKK